MPTAPAVRRSRHSNGEAARQSLAEAIAMAITDDASYSARDNAIKRAKVQIKLSRTSKSCIPHITRRMPNANCDFSIGLAPGDWANTLHNLPLP
jgi:hypothetical protein